MGFSTSISSDKLVNISQLSSLRAPWLSPALHPDTVNMEEAQYENPSFILISVNETKREEN